MITIDDFKKIELRVATIKEATRMENSEKMILLKISLGDQERQILSGIGLTYTPELLVGKQVVVIANLEPRSMMGLESNGMLLAASDEEGPVLLIPESEVEAGSGVR